MCAVCGLGCMSNANWCTYVHMVSILLYINIFKCALVQYA